MELPTEFETMTQSTLPKRQFDVAIFVATEDKHKQFSKKGRWSVEQDANNSLIHVTCLKTNPERIIRLALRKLPLMGGSMCTGGCPNSLALHPMPLSSHGWSVCG